MPMSEKKNWHQMNIEEIRGELKTDLRRGLTKEEAEKEPGNTVPTPSRKHRPGVSFLCSWDR